MESLSPALLMCSCNWSDGKRLSEWGYPGRVTGGGGLISITTIDRGRVVGGILSSLSFCVCVCVWY